MVEGLDSNQYKGVTGEQPVRTDEASYETEALDEDSLQDKLLREAGLFTSQRKYFKEGLVEATLDLKDHPTKAVPAVVAGVVLTAGLALASRNPGALFGAAKYARTAGLLGGGAAGGVDLFLRVKDPVVATWESGDNFEENKKQLGRNLGELGLNVIIGGALSVGTLSAMGYRTFGTSLALPGKSKYMPAIEATVKEPVLPALEAGPLPEAAVLKSLSPGRISEPPVPLAEGQPMLALPARTITHPDAPRLSARVPEPIEPLKPVKFEDMGVPAEIKLGAHQELRASAAGQAKVDFEKGIFIESRKKLLSRYANSEQLNGRSEPEINSWVDAYWKGMHAEARTEGSMTAHLGIDRRDIALTAEELMQVNPRLKGMSPELRDTWAKSYWQRLGDQEIRVYGKTGFQSLEPNLRLSPETERLLSEGLVSEMDIRAGLLGKELARLDMITGQVRPRSITFREQFDPSLNRFSAAQRDLVDSAYVEELQRRAWFDATPDTPMTTRVVDVISKSRSELLKDRPHLAKLAEREGYSDSDLRALLIGEEHARFDVQAQQVKYSHPNLVRTPEYARLDDRGRQIMLNSYKEAVFQEMQSRRIGGEVPSAPQEL